ncbi:MAG: FGGY-family carbohydrate kinase [Gammaproteobacteria bacterium]|nr:FGGY-family carbohydrate kinase [Gammaproteobacteria bacterium]
MNTWLGIDCGTSAVRACLVDEQDNQLALTRHVLDTQQPAAWQDAVTGCLKAVFRKHPADRVKAIAIDGTSGTILLCNPQGKVLTDVLMYNDASASGKLGMLYPPPDSPALSATAGLPKILQLAGQIRGQPAVVQHQADYISGWLCDRYGFSDENNALKTGYNLQTREWPDWVINSLPENITLPDVKIPGSPIGHAGKLLRSLGISANTQIVAGTTDSTAAFLATGVTRLDQGVTTLGSTLVIKQLSDREIVDSERGIYSHRLGNAWLTGGASNSGGNVLNQYFSNEQIRSLSQQIDPRHDSGLDYYPLTTAGERFPTNDPELQPRLKPRPTNDHEFLKGMMEGIAHIEASGYETLKSLGAAPIKEVISAGGGAINPVWSRIRERIMATPVSQARHTEAAYGAARLARYGAGLFEQF